MCVRKDLGNLPPFYFNIDKIPQCSIDDILLDDDEIPDLKNYKLRDDQIEWIDNWPTIKDSESSSIYGCPYFKGN